MLDTNTPPPSVKSLPKLAAATAPKSALSSKNAQTVSLILGQIELLVDEKDGQIRAGYSEKSGNQIVAKRDITTDVKRALVEHMMRMSPTGATQKFSLDGGKTWIKLTVEPTV